MKELFTNVVQFAGLAWWIEIVTENPRCTYYFGPFLSDQEAKADIAGYVEDLEQEGANGISASVKRCKPDDLTIDYDSGERFDRQARPSFSGQPL